MNNIMATLTISYDGRNRAARSVVEMLRNLDFLSISEPETVSRKEDPTLMTKEEYFAMLEKSRKQAERGEVFRFDDKQKMMDWLKSSCL